MIYPIFLDGRPDYMRRSREPASLLLAPVGGSRLVSFLYGAVAGTGCLPAVLSNLTPTDDYVDALKEACPEIDTVGRLADFRPGNLYEPSDWLLFIDPRYCFLDNGRLPVMIQDVLRSRSRATHLVTMSRHSSGTSESVELDDAGRVRRIQRYYDNATWPYLTGVASSLVSAAGLRTPNLSLAFSSLAELRAQLAGHGIPCRDVPLEGPVFDLHLEHELVRLNERILLDEVSRDSRAWPRQNHQALIDPTARLVGPVVVHDGARVAAGAVIVGPSVVGPGARVGRNAVVAQSVLGAGIEVPASATINYRAVFGEVDDTAGACTEDSGAAEGVTSELGVDHRSPPDSYRRAKAAIDCALALAALIVLSPFLALIAAVIKIDSRGPVFFSDLREGEGGRLFRCLKFRTMRQGSDARQRQLRNEVDGPQFKLEKDPRLTRVGRWLRPMSIDEVPQLFNVVLGQMSLIGPRPSPFRENQTCIPWREARLSVRPGITGLWQVCRYNRRDGDFHQWIYFDLLYVQHMSWWVDLKIFIATILTRGGQSNVPVHRIIAPRKLAS